MSFLGGSYNGFINGHELNIIYRHFLKVPCPSRHYIKASAAAKRSFGVI